MEINHRVRSLLPIPYPQIPILLLIAINCMQLQAVDFLFRPKGFLFIPMGAGNISSTGTARYEMGAGADIQFELDLSSIWSNRIGLGYTVGLEAGMTTNAVLTTTPQNLMTYSIGVSVGIYYFPFSRLFLRIDGTAGIFVPAINELIGPLGIYWRGGGEIGFRFSPTFLIAANASWRQYGESALSILNPQPVNSGFSAGLTLQFTFETGSGASNDGAQAVLSQSDPVYPAFFQLYQTSPVGSLVVSNLENAEIRNVRVSFRAPPFTSSEFICGTVSSIAKGRSVEIPLFADFSPDILRFIDSGRILGEVVVRYNFLGQERTAVSAITVACHNRNTIVEGDLAMLGAFISSTSTETREYSRYVVGLARARGRIGHNQNMQFAIWLLEGLRASGIRIGENYAKENEVQFPAETLAYGTGSSRDMALLFAASLESVGIPSAIITIGTDYLVAVNLAIGSAAAETLFSNQDWVLNINDEIWLPIALSAFNDGFMACWTRAAVSLNQAFERGEFVDFLASSEAWLSYPPAPLPELGGRLIRTESELIISQTENSINLYISQEIMPLIWTVEAQIISNPTAALYNRLGILLARAGRIAEAKYNYERAATMGLVAAMTNRGNLALNERDYDVAEYWFLQALRVDSGNSIALRGIDRVEGRR